MRQALARGSESLSVAVLVALASIFPYQAYATGMVAEVPPGYAVLYTFTGGMDGAAPIAGLVSDSAGNLYGTTQGGGYGYGTVFKVSPTGAETVLHRFSGSPDGADPFGVLIRDEAGNLYGTTLEGGSSSNLGCGTIFKISSDGDETVLYRFLGEADGCDPYGGLILDNAGNLYGTASEGGSAGYGVVFRFNLTTRSENPIYTFTGGTDGGRPYAGLISDSTGTLYGTASLGGAYGYGVVFSLTPTGTESVLYSFTGGPGDGTNPSASLVRDPAGNLYGTTPYGGLNWGVVFKLHPTGTETTLHRFVGGSDGAAPWSNLILDSSGNLYGTTEWGGSNGCPVGCGTVFMLSPSGSETILYRFRGLADGASPYFAGLIHDSAGNLYGTTFTGGYQGNGVVFKLSKRSGSKLMLRSRYSDDNP